MWWANISIFRNFLLSFTAIFVALDIVGTLPLYVSMTRDLAEEKKNEIVNQSMTVALVVAVVFIFLGEAIFRYLGIQIFDFKMAGGLVLLLLSLMDLIGNPEVANRVSGSTGVVPLAVPLITGPAVLTTIVLEVGSLGYLATLSALLANYGLAWMILRRSQKITGLIGKDGTVVVSKIAALLLAAIAIALMRTGIFEAFTWYRANIG